jgi:hypothetical protein
MTRQGCAETVSDNLGLRRYACSRGGTIEYDSQHWCWQHDPEAVRKRRTEQQARWADENRQRAEANRRLAAERLAVGFLSTDALDAGIVKARFTSHDRLANAARDISARLRAVGGGWNILLAQDLESALKEAHSG